MSFTIEQIVEILNIIKTDLEIQIHSEKEGKGINMGDIIDHCNQLINRVGDSSLPTPSKVSLLAFAHAPWGASPTLEKLEYHLKNVTDILKQL